MLLSMYVYAKWTSFNIFFGGDWVFYFSNFLKSFLSPSSWAGVNQLGAPDLLIWRMPINFLQGIFGFLGYGSNVSEKILIFWPTLIVANISSFFLVKKITKSSLAGFVGAIVFNYNTYFFVINTAFLLYSAAAWSVLTLYIFIHALEKKKLYLFILSGLTLFLTGSYDFRIAYVSIFLLGLYFLFHALFIEKLNWKVVRKNFACFILQGFVFGLLNLYWIISFIKSNSLATNVILQRGLFGNEFSNVLYAIALFHPFWTGGETTYFNPQIIFTYFWLIPIFSFLGLYLNRKNKNVLFFGVVALIGIFLTKQVAVPFTGVYAWLFTHLPGFNAFREASKFYYLIVLGYAVLIGSVISWLLGRPREKKFELFAKCLFVILVVTVFLWNAKPIVTGEIGGIFVPRHISQDYYILGKDIIDQNSFYRDLWLPTALTWSETSINNPILSGAIVLQNDWAKIFQNYFYDQTQTTSKLLIADLNKKEAPNLLRLSSIKYIFIPGDSVEDGNMYTYFYYGENEKYFIDKLNNINYLHKIDFGTKIVAVYEIKNYRPHVYATAQKESIYKNLPPMIYDVSSNLITSSQYKVSAKNIKAPFYLNFSEAYNSEWKLRVGDFNWFYAITDKQYFLSDKYHFQNDATLNSFYIDPQVVCNVQSCKVNKDGTYDINMTLYFAPQSYLYLGLIISGSILALALGYLVFVFGRNIYAKHN